MLGVRSLGSGKGRILVSFSRQWLATKPPPAQPASSQNGDLRGRCAARATIASWPTSATSSSPPPPSATSRSSTRGSTSRSSRPRRRRRRPESAGRHDCAHHPRPCELRSRSPTRARPHPADSRRALRLPAHDPTPHPTASRRSLAARRRDRLEELRCLLDSYEQATRTRMSTTSRSGTRPHQKARSRPHQLPRPALIDRSARDVANLYLRSLNAELSRTPR